MKDIKFIHENGDMTIKLTLSKLLPLYELKVLNRCEVISVVYIADYVEAIRRYLSQIASELAVTGQNTDEFVAIENLVN